MRTLLSVVLALLVGVFAESNFSVSKLAARALSDSTDGQVQVERGCQCGAKCTCGPNCPCCPACPGKK